MFYGIVPMLVLTDFFGYRFVIVTQICAKSKICVRAVNSRISARRWAKYLSTKIGTISRNMPTYCNFEPKRLKRKLDILKKPENRVHRLTDSNVSQPMQHFGNMQFNAQSPYKLGSITTFLPNSCPACPMQQINFGEDGSNHAVCTHCTYSYSVRTNIFIYKLFIDVDNVFSHSSHLLI